MASTPAKVKSRKPVTSAAKPKPRPGTAAKRSAPMKQPKTLDKVLSKETEQHRRSMSRGPSGIIALLRSTSTSMLKREASEPLSITNVPKKDSEANDTASAESAPVPVRRRPVEDKVKKEAMVQAELQDVINSVRRPNRDVVGKAMAEAAERRATTSLSQLRSKFYFLPTARTSSTLPPRLTEVIRRIQEANATSSAVAERGQSNPGGCPVPGRLQPAGHVFHHCVRLLQADDRG